MYDKYIYLPLSGICRTGARGLGLCLQQCLFLVTVKEMGQRWQNILDLGLLEVVDGEADVLSGVTSCVHGGGGA